MVIQGEGSPIGPTPTPTRSRQVVVVLQSIAAPSDTTRYVNQISEGVPREVRLHYFSWRNALFARYDIFHVHWPEYLIRGTRPSFTALKSVLFMALWLRLWLTGTPVVRTLHNVKPHEGGTKVESLLLRLLTRQTEVFIRLNPTTQIPTQKILVTILHGHYKDRFAEKRWVAPIESRLLYFGLLRPYKGVEQLLHAFSACDKSLSLAVVGKPSSPAYIQVVKDAQVKDDRITSDLRFVDDDTLTDHIGQAELVVLPYTEMHNSGAMLLALSLNRPVLVPKGEVVDAISREVGPGWVLTFSGALTSKMIEQALSETRHVERTAEARMEQRDWVYTGEQHYQAYLSALHRARR